MKIQQLFTALVAVLTVFALAPQPWRKLLIAEKVEQAPLLWSPMLHKVKLTLPINSLTQL